MWMGHMGREASMSWKVSDGTSRRMEWLEFSFGLAVGNWNSGTELRYNALEENY